MMCEGRFPSISELGKDFPGSSNRLVDVLLGVCQGGETGLVGRRSQIDAFLQHLAVPPAEFLGVALGGVGPTCHRPLREEEAIHATDVATRDGVAVLSGSLQNAVD